MTEILAIAAVVVIPAILGLGLLRVAGPRALTTGDSWLWAYPTGITAIAAIVGIWIAAGFPMVRWLGVLLPLVLGAGLLAIAARRRNGVPRLPRERVPIACLVVLVLVLAAIIQRFAVLDLEPIAVSDEAWIWTFRAKLLLRDWVEGAPLPRAVRDLRVLPHADYPLLGPLVDVWTYCVAGRIDDVLPRVPVHAVYLSLVAGTAAIFSSLLRPAAACIFMLLWLPGTATRFAFFPATGDLFEAAGFLLALEAWRRFARDGDAGAWRLFAFAMTILVWAKHEGSMLVIAIVAAAAIHAWRDPAARAAVRGLRGGLGWLALPAAAIAATWTVNAAEGFRNDMIGGNPTGKSFLETIGPQLGARAGTVARWLWDEIVTSPDRSRLLWIPFLAAIVFMPRKSFSRERVQPTLAILFAAAGYFLVFVGSYQDVRYHLATAAIRVFLHPWPALLLWSARFFAELFPAAAMARRPSVPSAG